MTGLRRAFAGHSAVPLCPLSAALQQVVTHAARAELATGEPDTHQGVGIDRDQARHCNRCGVGTRDDQARNASGFSPHCRRIGATKREAAERSLAACRNLSRGTGKFVTATCSE